MVSKETNFIVAPQMGDMDLRRCVWCPHHSLLILAVLSIRQQVAVCFAGSWLLQCPMEFQNFIQIF